MYSIQLLKSNKGKFTYKIINWAFVLSGANFYMNWLLPTNPQSKNRIIKSLWHGLKYNNPKERYKMAYIFGSIHLILCFMNLLIGLFWSLQNILVNIYPIIVQLYIGYRCYKLIK